MDAMEVRTLIGCVDAFRESGLTGYTAAGRVSAFILIVHPHTHLKV